MPYQRILAHSPLSALEPMLAAKAATGMLNVVMARAGVGKTAFLVHVGLFNAAHGRDVLHVALGHALEHVHAWYDALLDGLVHAAAIETDVEEREFVRARIGRHRVIQAQQERALTAERLEKLVALYSRHMQLDPRVLLVDGFEWEGPATERAAEVGAMKELAVRLGAELWMSAQTHRSSMGGVNPVTSPCDACAALVDQALFLEPEDDQVRVLLAVPTGGDLRETGLRLDCDGLMAGTAAGAARLPAYAYTLLSGGAQGAEAEFGAAAEAWGVSEMHFTFAGRDCLRERGRVLLSDEELAEGEVSRAYVEAKLHRPFPEEERKVVQSIWHQVATAGEVFVVGKLMPDGTVRGGTGWAVELARSFEKPVHVFDQELEAWHDWRDGAWARIDPPRIRRVRFAGTGTRYPSPAARDAIRRLFADSFGSSRG